MKIMDEVFIHGYVDEIRNDTVIIRNKGGYFGTDKTEVFDSIGYARGVNDTVDSIMLEIAYTLQNIANIDGYSQNAEVIQLHLIGLMKNIRSKKIDGETKNDAE